jgi:hypothetical protein
LYYLYIVLNISCVSVFYLGPINWYQSMATNKDRIEKLEMEIQELKEGMQKMSAESQLSPYLIPHQFLHMNLADKVHLRGRDNDRFIIMG